MDAGDVKQAVIKYWPYLLGGAIGLWLLTRNRGGSGGTSDYGAFLQSQTAAGVATAQANGQLEIARAQIAASENAANREHAYNLEAIGIQKQKVYADAMIGFNMSQAEMAKGIGASAGSVIGALNGPAMMAMEAAALENAAAMGASAQVAVGGYQAQADIVGHTSSVLDSVAKNSNMSGAFAGLTSGGLQPQQSTGSQMLGMVAEGVAAYYTGGASLAVTQGRSFSSAQGGSRAGMSRGSLWAGN